MKDSADITFQLNEGLLTPVLERLFNGQVSVSAFEISALKPGLGNPTSLGVYRVSGHTETGENFSVVVKHLATGLPIMDASSPSFWNYWKREIDFFESPLARRIPDSIDHPGYLGQSTLPDGTTLFWNQDLGELEKSVWTWEECLHATRLVAQLNSIDISDSDDYLWLNRNQLEGWLELKPMFFDHMHQPVIDFALSQSESAKAFEVYGRYLPMQEELKDLLNSQRRVFAHGDFNLNNLVPRSKSVAKLIALDWQLCGLAAIGSEVAALFNTANELGVIEADDALFEEMCSVYVEEFNECNPGKPTTLDEVRVVAAAQGLTILNGVGFYFVQPDPAKSDEENNQKIRNMIEFFSSGPMLVYAKALRELSDL